MIGYGPKLGAWARQFGRLPVVPIELGKRQGPLRGRTRQSLQQ